MITAFFDADCGFCTKSVNFMERLQPKNFRWVPYGTEDALLAAAHFQFSDSQNFVVAVSPGSKLIAKGPEVFWLALALQTRFPKLGALSNFLSRVMSTAPGSAVSWKVYRFIASRRNKLSGSGATCDVG